MPESTPQKDLLTVTSVSAAVRSSGLAASVPTAEPPASVAAGAAGASLWVNGKKINALWAINESRNSSIGVAGVGWVKLANNSDSAIVAFTILGASAKQTQGTVNYRQEADNMIHEMYVW
jgi:hypothetical protein